MVRPGEMDEESFIQELQRINRERLDQGDWSLNEDQKQAITHGTDPLWMPGRRPLRRTAARSDRTRSGF